MSDLAFMIASAAVVALGVALRLSVPRGGFGAGAPAPPRPRPRPAE